MAMKPYVLLVEDNPDDEILTLDALRTGGVTGSIQVARDGAEALEVLGGNQLPKLVLLDLKLPKISGLDVLIRIRKDERTRRIPVVVLTSSNEDQDVRASYTVGANSFLRKPVDFQEFTRMVATLAVYWMDFNRTSN